MKISLNWLKQFVDIQDSITPEELGLALTLKTVEVEGIERQGKYLENVVVGEIKEIKAHPNADKLKVCIVDVGEKNDLQIICGGINLREGMFVAVAKIGARVKWHGGEEVEIIKTKIRGEESFGMICATEELELEHIIKQENEADIVDLGKYQVLSIKYQVGKPLAGVLGLDDVIFDIDNKSLTNRPDLWGHYGIAREVSAIFPNTKYLILDTLNIKNITNKAKKNVEISVKVEDSDLCPRYMAVAMSNIKIAPSPQWMQNRLISVGMRPINNIVDITNFVMFELGQPMHAFDKFKVQSSKFKVGIQIRKSGKGEKITTLDEEDRVLDDSMLVIACLRRQADSEKPIAIAGVMGGANSEIDENTMEIILESANFEKVNNRKTASKLGLRTEASARYEKGLDPALCEQALVRCVELIKEIIPEAVMSSSVVDVGVNHCVYPVSQIEISLDYLRKKIGVEIEEKRIVEILESLGFGVEIPPLTPPCKGGESSVPLLAKEGLGVVFKIKIPSWRATGDISIADDIVEEVARIYGYDDIQPKMPEVVLEPPLENKKRKLERKIKNILSSGFGMSETSNYSFVNEKQLEILGIRAKCVKLLNPLSSENSLLRPSLIPNLLNNVKNNLRYFDKFAMFEIGSVFKDEEGDIPAKISNFKFQISNVNQEKTYLKEIKGNDNKKVIEQYLPWQEKFVAGIIVDDKNSAPFYKAKEAVERLLQELGVSYLIEEGGQMEEIWMHPYRAIKFQISPACAGRNFKFQKEAGYITELNPVVAGQIGIKNARVGVFNLSLKSLLELSGGEIKYKSLSKYPAIIRDLAIVVDKKVLYKEIVDLIYGVDDLIKSVELFDIFENEKLGIGKKSMAFHINFHSAERTLTDGEVENIFKKIVGVLEKKIGAEVRG